MALGSKSTTSIRTAVDSILREFCKYDEEREKWFQEKQRLEREINSYKKELETKDKDYEILLKRYKILELSIKNNQKSMIPSSNGQDKFIFNENAMKSHAIKIKLKSKKKDKSVWSRTLPTSLSPQKLLGFIDDFSGKFNGATNNNNNNMNNNNINNNDNKEMEKAEIQKEETKNEENNNKKEEISLKEQTEKPTITRQEQQKEETSKKGTTKSGGNNNNSFKLQLTPSITLRHHLDCVRSLCLNDDESVLISGSDDGTIKLWDLNKISGQLSSSYGNVGNGHHSHHHQTERTPIPITFRGHLSSVNCCCIVPNTNILITGSFDTNIFGWKLPLNGTILMEMESLSTLRHFEMKKHSDIIWDIVPHYSQPLIASISADNTCKIYNIHKEELVMDYKFNKKLITQKYIGQTSLKWNNFGGNEKLCISTISGHILLFDIEKQEIISSIYDNKFNYCINRIYCDDGILNNSSLIYSACDDSRVRLFDIKSNKCIISQKVHTDSVTSMVIHSSSSSILTASHDSRLRVWDFKINKFSCCQDLDAHDTHNIKWDQGIIDMTFDNNHKWLFSGGADGVRIYKTNL